MLEVLKDVFNIILLSFGLEIELGLIVKQTFFIVSGPLILILLYYLAWERVQTYSRLMDRYVLELWTREESEVGQVEVHDDVRNMRLERLKVKYEDKINNVQKKRNRLFRWVPFLKRLYIFKKGKNAPMYTLP